MIRKLILKIISWIHLDYLPTKIQKGPGKGLKWTLLPYSMYWRGETEKEMDQIISNLKLKKNVVVWDLGAHFGYYSLIFAKLFPQGKIYAFEPDPKSFGRLKYHLKINHNKNIKAFNVAVGEKNGVAFLDQSDGAGEPTNKITQSGLKIQIIAIDHWIEEKNFESPDLIKIDIEGYGGEAILGGLKTIKSKKPIFIFSFHNNQEIKKVQQILAPLGYQAFNDDRKPVKWGKLKGTILLYASKIS